MSESSPVRSVARAIDILLALADGPQSLGDICERVELSKGTGHRLLAGLGYRGLVVQAPDGDYLLGPGCFRIVEGLTQGLGGLSSIARPVLEQLRGQTGETITLHIRQGAQRICVEELPSAHAVRYTAGIGAAAPIHVGSAGKALLAFADEREVDRLLSTGSLQGLTEHTLTDVDALRRELNDIRNLGHAVSHGERVPGATAVTVPIFDDGGHLLSVLSVLGPDARMGPDQLREYSELAQTAADEVGRQVREIQSVGE